MKKTGTAAARLALAVAIGLCFVAEAPGPEAAKPSRARPATVSQAAKSPAIFLEAAARTGLVFRHFTGATGNYYLPEITAAGVGLLDYDRDGDLDVYFVQDTVLQPGVPPSKTLYPWTGPGRPRGRLFRNDLVVEPDGTRRLHFTDVTAKSGINATGYGMGVAVGDINNDGWPDIYLTNLGSNQMYLNNGDGTFTDVTAKTGTDDPRWSTSAAFFDYDRDGWLDLFVANYVDFSVKTSPNCYARDTARDYCGPQAFHPVPDRLFHNNGDGTFTDVTEKAGIDQAYGNGLGVVTADFDGDGWPDIYVANDGVPNQLWINQKDGTFKNEALLAGAAVNRDGAPEAGMGVDAGDFDGNGTPDIFITHLMEETNTLFVNLGKGLFEDRTYEAGLAHQLFTGFGTLWFDYDNDGWLDLLTTNGAVRRLLDAKSRATSYPFAQENQLFHNDGKGHFVNVSAAAGPAFNRPVVGRGAAFGDLDNDGDTDVVISNNNGKAELLLNQVGNQEHWLGLRLIGGKHGRYMLGARVAIVVNKNRTLWRRVRTDGGYCSAQDPRVLAGLGGATSVDKVEVYWPSGQKEEWLHPPIDRYITLAEGSAPRILPVVSKP